MLCGHSFDLSCPLIYTCTALAKSQLNPSKTAMSHDVAVAFSFQALPDASLVLRFAVRFRFFYALDMRVFDVLNR